MNAQIYAIKNLIRARKDGKIIAALLDECEIEIDSSTQPALMTIRTQNEQYKRALMHQPVGMCVDWAYVKLYDRKCKTSIEVAPVAKKAE